MRSRIHPMFAVLMLLMAIGIFDQLRRGLQSLWIPVVLVAAVYLLYKFPPDRWPLRRNRVKARKPQRQTVVRLSAKTKRRPVPFRVIEGKKDKQDDPPPYH